MKLSSLVIVAVMIGTCLARQRKGSVDEEEQNDIQNRDGKCMYSVFLVNQIGFKLALFKRDWQMLNMLPASFPSHVL